MTNKNVNHGDDKDDLWYDAVADKTMEAGDDVLDKNKQSPTKIVDEVAHTETCETEAFDESDTSASPRSCKDLEVEPRKLIQEDEMVNDEMDPFSGMLEPVDENMQKQPQRPPFRSSVYRDKTTKIDFLKDPLNEMTRGRRIALRLMNKPWYNPRAAAPAPANECGSETPSTSSLDVKEKSSNNIGAQNAETPEDEENLRCTARKTFDDSYPFSHATRENPSLEKAWAYFEHVALARFIVPEKKKPETKNIALRVLHRFMKANKTLARAEAGEQYVRTKLYRPVFTPHKQLGDWGLGVGLYFSALRAIMLLTFVAGLANIPNMLYFASEDYNGNPQEKISKRLLQASAICTDTTWVLCNDCTSKEFANSRLVLGEMVGTDKQATFALRNNCEGATYRTGFVSLATLVLIVVGMAVINRYLNAMEVAFDEDEQTAQDYSIVIQNPPGDATDPDEWRRFFHERFDEAHVTACTIAVDNDLLVRSLVERREVLRRLDLMLEPGTSLNSLTLARIAAKQERERRYFGRLKAMIIPGVPELFARLVVLTAKIQGLAQQDYPATKVFLSFETEAGQRHVLNALNVGKWGARRNNAAAVGNPQHLFRGHLVLEIDEPDEPNTVRWQDLNETGWNRFKQQALTTLCTMVAVVVIALIVNVCNESSIEFSAFSIAIFNTAFPMFAKFLTTFEKHASEGGKERSLYFKISLFRLVNTAVVITIITPFTMTLENDGGLISQVYALFFAEIVTTNLIQFSDPVGHIMRHFLAPRAKTQDAMNMNMQGQEFYLAERYTNMTKLLFLTVWYCAIYPGSLFMCSFALLVNYFMDRFSLMRTWKRAPALGSQMSKFSRRYFFPVSIVSMALLSSFYWAGFPFDNLCLQDQQIGDEFAGTWKVGNYTYSLAANDQAFGFCLQNFWRYGKGEKKFPFIPEFQREGAEWMTDDQETISAVWGWTSVAVIVLVFLALIYSWFRSFRGMFHGKYKPCGNDQKVNFSDVASISAYIPLVNSNMFSYPLLACRVDEIDSDLLDWIDPDRPFKYYDLTEDADVLLRGIDVSSKIVFSRVFHWPPPSEEAEVDDVVDGGEHPSNTVEDCA
ncbi:hypothetical protein ACA910_012587 [Epithemia clementina (nom. ined.)]